MPSVQCQSLASCLFATMKAFRQAVHRGRPVFQHVTAANRNYCTQPRADNIVKSSVPHVPLPNLSLDEYLLHKAGRWSDKIALECAETGRHYTFGETQRYAERFSQALCAKFGYRKGDTVAIMVPNIPEFIIAMLATLRAGIVITTINPVYTEDEVARQLKDADVKAVIALATNYKTVENGLRKLRPNVPIPIITIKHQKTDTTPAGAIDFKELIDYTGPEVRLDSPTMEDLALLAYSSGTSGLPKGVQLVHRNISSNLCQVQHDLIRITADTTQSHQDIVPIIAPLFHCYGMIPIAFNAFSEGCKSIMLPKYTPVTFLNMLDKYPCNVMQIVPPITIMMTTNEAAKPHHVRQCRHIVTAAAPFGASDADLFKKKFGQHIALAQYYGLTETGPVSHAARVDRPVVPGSVGYTLHLTESRIVAVDDETKNLPANQDGHLLLRGDGIMKGYHNNPKATAEALDADGWLRTGDIGHYDEQGVFYITDRIKELIKVKGFQVAPAELEALIREHPDVTDAAVTSVPHKQNGEGPKAFVVVRQDSKLRPEQVQEYVKQKAAKYKQLTGGVVFVNSIPKNPSGKILRRLLKQL